MLAGKLLLGAQLFLSAAVDGSHIQPLIWSALAPADGFRSGDTIADTGSRAFASEPQSVAQQLPAPVTPTGSPCANRDAGRRLEITSIIIEGNQRVPVSQILGILAQESIRPGTTIPAPDDPQIRRARERLIMTGWFAKVTPLLRLVDKQAGAAQLIVRVEERGTLTVEHLYLGSSKLTAFRGGIDVLDRNVLGRGIHVGGGFIWGTQPAMSGGRHQHGYHLIGYIPLGRVRRVPTAIEGELKWLSASEPLRRVGAPSDANPQNFRAVNYDRAGGRLGLVFAPASDIRVNVGVRMEALWKPGWTGLGQQPANREERFVEEGLWPQLHRLSSLRVGFEFDRKQYNVGQGIRVRGEMEISTPAVLSSYQYIRAVGDFAYGFRLPWRHYLTPSFAGGVIGGVAPRFEQFFAGDLSPWTPGRELGLIYSTRGPIDVFNTGIGSRTLGNFFGRVDLEYSWPLFRKTRLRNVHSGDLFWSVGLFTLASLSSSTGETGAQHDAVVAPIGLSAGLGIRLDTTLGVLELSVGNLLRRTPL